MIAGQSGPRLLSALNTNTDAFFIESIEKYSVWIRVRQRALRHNIYDVLSFSVIPNTCLSLTCPPGVSGVHDLSWEGSSVEKGQSAEPSVHVVMLTTCVCICIRPRPCSHVISFASDLGRKIRL